MAQRNTILADRFGPPTLTVPVTHMYGGQTTFQTNGQSTGQTTGQITGQSTGQTTGQTTGQSTTSGQTTGQDNRTGQTTCVHYIDALVRFAERGCGHIG
jgi:hypothetical protein